MRKKIERVITVIVMVVAAVAFGRQITLCHIEQQKSKVLREIIVGHSFAKVDEALRKSGRPFNLEEASTVAFPTGNIDGEASLYWLEGGLMARVFHRNDRILSIDIRKLEFSSN